jgi:hypothetical protein
MSKKINVDKLLTIGVPSLFGIFLIITGGYAIRKYYSNKKAQKKFNDWGITPPEKNEHDETPGEKIFNKKGEYAGTVSKLMPIAKAHGITKRNKNRNNTHTKKK